MYIIYNICTYEWPAVEFRPVLKIDLKQIKQVLFSDGSCTRKLGFRFCKCHGEKNGFQQGKFQKVVWTSNLFIFWTFFCYCFDYHSKWSAPSKFTTMKLGKLIKNMPKICTKFFFVKLALKEFQVLITRSVTSSFSN